MCERKGGEREREKVRERRERERPRKHAHVKVAVRSANANAAHAHQCGEMQIRRLPGFLTRATQIIPYAYVIRYAGKMLPRKYRAVFLRRHGPRSLDTMKERERKKESVRECGSERKRERERLREKEKITSYLRQIAEL